MTKATCEVSDRPESQRIDCARAPARGTSDTLRRCSIRFACAALVLAFWGVASSPATASDNAYQRIKQRTEQRVDCDQSDALRRPYFGDTHVHTTHSQDASTQDTRVTPSDAYAFARGEAMGIQPYDAEGHAQRTVKLARPLDFAVVTDHAEQIGEVHICKTPGMPGHDSWVCRIYRSYPRIAFYMMNTRYAVLGTRWGFCGDDGAECTAAARSVWRGIQRAAESAYDRSSACEFTSFVGYEWTAGPDFGAHLHRNVIFRNEKVPDQPISVMETGFEGLLLWESLERDCRLGKPGCEAITIPHNANIGGGYTFTSAEELGEEITERETPLRARYERLFEVMQHKGDSECALVPGTTDEECGFEKGLRAAPISFGDKEVLAVNYVRDALKRGVALTEELGENPLKLGLIGSTDTHLGAPGLVAERGHPGHGGAGKYASEGVPPGLPDDIEFNPGGLAVLWAEENSRDALFDAMLRREAYGTSGNRPEVRLFGGWEFEPTLCEDPNWVARGYAGGVPMGGDLRQRPGETSTPTFIVAASRDPAPWAGPLQKVQLVKGWVDSDGSQHEKVVVVVGGDNGADVDLATCEPRGEGADRLCGVWRDPDFDASEGAFYYARVLENPSCRWSQWACVDAGVDCARPETIGEGFEPCCSEHHGPVIHERAWTSPIWYTP